MERQRAFHCLHAPELEPEVEPKPRLDADPLWAPAPGAGPAQPARVEYVDVGTCSSRAKPNATCALAGGTCAGWPNPYASAP
jgi:hypothetical protein